MSILDITADNFNITVADVSKKVEVEGYAKYDRERDNQIVWKNPNNGWNHSNHVKKIVSNRLIKAVKKLVPGYPTGLQVRDVVEGVLGKKVTCRVQRYTGRDLKNVVSYNLGERGESEYNGTSHHDVYKGTRVEVKFTRIDIIY